MLGFLGQVQAGMSPNPKTYRDAPVPTIVGLSMQPPGHSVAAPSSPSPPPAHAVEVAPQDVDWKTLLSPEGIQAEIDDAAAVLRRIAEKEEEKKLCTALKTARYVSSPKRSALSQLVLQFYSFFKREDILPQDVQIWRSLQAGTIYNFNKFLNRFSLY